MTIQRFRPLEGSRPLPEIQKDFRSSRKLEKYRLSENALYFPAGFSWMYLPLDEITEIRRVTRVIQSENGVCPFSMEVPGIRIFFHGKSEILETEKEKSVEMLLQLRQN